MGSRAVACCDEKEGKPMMDKPDTPFPRHWLYYLTIKIVVLLLAAAAALYFLGVV
jgi:hypothetical protein